MRFDMARWFPALVAPLAALVLTANASAASYTLTALGTLGGSKSYAYGINNNGQVVGTAFLDSSTYHAFVYSNGSMSDLGTLGGYYSNGLAINNNGQVAGNAWTPDNQPHAYVYGSGAMTDIGTLGGLQSYAHAINDNGLVGGWSQTGAGYQHAFVYTGTVTYDRGGGPTNTTTSSIYGLTSTGRGVGQAGNGHAAILDRGGAITDLGTFGGAGSCAWTVNDNMQIGGWAQTPDAVKHPFFYQNGLMTNLGGFGGAYGSVYSLNSTGVAVGMGTDASSTRHAFIYQAGALQDLNGLIDPSTGWYLESAQSINDNGQIVGYGFNPDGAEQAFLLTPTTAVAAPLPGALPMGLAGLAGVAALTRRTLARRGKK